MIIQISGTISMLRVSWLIGVSRTAELGPKAWKTASMISSVIAAFVAFLTRSRTEYCAMDFPTEHGTRARRKWFNRRTASPQGGFA